MATGQFATNNMLLLLRYALLLLLPLASIPLNAFTSITQNPVDFGNVQVGGGPFVSSTILETDDFAPPLGPISGAIPESNISFTGNCNTLATSFSCFFEFTWDPEAAGPLNENWQPFQQFPNVNIQTVGNANCPPGQVPGNNGFCQPIQPSLDIPSPINFGPVTPGGSTSQSILVTNDGNTEVSITSTSVSGQGFTLGNTNSCAGTVLMPTQQCSVQVEFSGSSPGQFNGNITVDGLGEGQAIAASGVLQASIVTPALNVDPASIDFGDQDQGTTSATSTVTLSNTGSVPVSFDQISLNLGAGAFSLTNNCSTELTNNGDQCTLGVTFSPAGLGQTQGQITINSSAGTRIIALAGNGQETGEDTVYNALIDHAGGDPSREATVAVIANSCTDGANRITPQLQNDCGDLIDAALADESGISEAIKEITPEEATKANQILRNAGQAQRRNIGQRLVGLRANSQGSVSIKGLEVSLPDQNISVEQFMGMFRSDYAQGFNTVSEQEAPENQLLYGSNFGFFIDGTISSGERDQTALESSLDFETLGVTAGIDYRWNQSFIIGTAIGYLNTDSDIGDNQGELEADGQSISLYGSYFAADMYFLDFSITYGTNDFDQERIVAYQLGNNPAVYQVMNADYDGDYIEVAVATGYDFYKDALSFGPRLNMDYTRSDIDQFDEAASDPNGPGAGWAAHLDSSNQEWLTLELGGQASYVSNTNWGVMVNYLQLNWLHEFKEDAMLFTGNFVADMNGHSLVIYGDNPDRDYARLRVGTSFQLPHGVSGFFDYGTTLAHEYWSGHALTMGVRFEF